MIHQFNARLNGNRRPVWEGLGSQFDRQISATQAFAETGLNFTVSKNPMLGAVNYKDKLRPITVPNRYVLFREPGEYSSSYVYFGECGKEFEIVQREDLAKMIDPLTVRWPIVSVGEVNAGKTVFVVLNAGNMDIANSDPIQLNYMIVDTIDGGTSAKCLLTPLRIQCTNALLSALKSAVVSVSLNHRNGFGRQINFTMDLAHRMMNAQEELVETLELMARTKITAEDAMRIFEATYKMPSKSAKSELVDIIPESQSDLSDIRQQGLNAIQAFEYYANQAATMRKYAAETLEFFNGDNPRVANTAWAAYNAAVEMADWREGRGDVDKDALFGQRATEKRRAFSAAYNLATGG